MTDLSEKRVKVRKPHQCVWCGEGINIGESAKYRVYIFEGDFNADYYHLECIAATDSITNWADYDEGFEPHAFVRGSAIRKDEVEEDE